jgi:hypothetical protein
VAALAALIVAHFPKLQRLTIAADLLAIRTQYAADELDWFPKMFKHALSKVPSRVLQLKKVTVWEYGFTGSLLRSQDDYRLNARQPDRKLASLLSSLPKLSEL